MTLDILFIDNFDSFVFNLVDEFARRGCRIDVWRNDIAIDDVLDKVGALRRPRLVVLSPGPGAPSTAGCSIELVRRAPKSVPIFGICLGHQAIIEASGGSVGSAGEIVHGKPAQIEHNRRGLFQGIPAPMTAGRYHSLIATKVPESFEITAHLGEMVMAVEHNHRPTVSVQFHPESILTPHGGKLIDNVIAWAEAIDPPGKD